jgi:hypothetical protein
VENVNILEVITQISPLIRSKNPKGEADECPQVHRAVGAAEVVSNVVYLGMTVVAARDTVVGTCLDDLVEFLLAVGSAFLGISRLQEAAAAATTVVVGFVRSHLNQVFLTYNRPDNKTKVFSDRISITFPHYLAWVLNSELDFALSVPFRAYLQTSFPNPLSVILVNGCNLEVVFNTEFFQSSPD